MNDDRANAAAGRADGTLRYLSRADVEAVGLSMAEVIEAVEAGFRSKGRGAVELPAKTAVHPGGADSFIHAMPANIRDLAATGLKWIAGYPENQARGLPYINGLLIMNDPDSGIPVAVMDATWITAVRTAAASAVSSRYLARPNSRTLGILGCGVQGVAHVDALRCVLPELEEVRAYDPDPRRAASLAEAAGSQHGLRVSVVATPEAAVRDSDVIVTAGPILQRPHATIRPGWMATGAFASAVDFDSYWHAEALGELDLFTTDDVDQLEHFRSLGYFESIPPIAADLGELVAGAHPGRTGDDQRTMACNLGVAIDDVAVGAAVLRLANEQGIGTVLPL